LLLEQLAVLVVVLVLDAILLHHVIIQELVRSADAEAPTVSHTETLRHFIFFFNVEFLFLFSKKLDGWVGPRENPRAVLSLGESGDPVIEPIPQYCVEGFRCVHRGYLDFFSVAGYVQVDDVVGECNLLHGLRASDDNFACPENTNRHFFHILCWLELDLDRRVPVGVKAHVENG